jgi:hypothetical protein
MRVRILSGSQAGAVVDMPDAEALQNVSSGFAELVPEVPVVSVPAAKAVKAPPKPKKAAKRKR